MCHCRELGHYCNGQRVTHQRIFEKMPVLLPVNTDCASSVQSIDFDSIPEVITVRSADAAIHM